MLSHLCRSVFVLFYIHSICNADLVTWEISGGGNGHSYEFISFSNGISWNEARDHADQHGYLATVTSHAENEFIFQLIQSEDLAWINVGSDSRGPWIGGFQTLSQSEPDEFSWITEEDFGFTAWANGEPSGTNSIGVNEDFIQFFATGNDSRAPTWNDLPEDGDGMAQAPRGYILEIEPVPEPSFYFLTILVLFMISNQRSIHHRQLQNTRRT